MRGAPQSGDLDTHLLNRRTDFGLDLRSPSQWARLLAPVAAKAGPMPTHERLGTDNHEDLSILRFKTKARRRTAGLVDFPLADQRTCLREESRLKIKTCPKLKYKLGTNIRFCADRLRVAATASFGFRETPRSPTSPPLMSSEFVAARNRRHCIEDNKSSAPPNLSQHELIDTKSLRLGMQNKSVVQVAQRKAF
jgi:hypothetical protein